mmetsp:Transcript_19953/g.43390  ORF Transcript_19953/g.43390 Transcript_19953/m.43390 type:complete len:240 (+) Transcript_19953:1556-2275(+)
MRGGPRGDTFAATRIPPRVAERGERHGRRRREAVGGAARGRRDGGGRGSRRRGSLSGGGPQRASVGGARRRFRQNDRREREGRFEHGAAFRAPFDSNPLHVGIGRRRRRGVRGHVLGVREVAESSHCRFLRLQIRHRGYDEKRGHVPTRSVVCRTVSSRSRVVRGGGKNNFQNSYWRYEPSATLQPIYQQPRWWRQIYKQWIEQRYQSMGTRGGNHDITVKSKGQWKVHERQRIPFIKG